MTKLLNVPHKTWCLAKQASGPQHPMVCPVAVGGREELPPRLGPTRWCQLPTHHQCIYLKVLQWVFGVTWYLPLLLGFWSLTIPHYKDIYMNFPYSTLCFILFRWQVHWEQQLCLILHFCINSTPYICCIMRNYYFNIVVKLIPIGVLPQITVQTNKQGQTEIPCFSQTTSKPRDQLLHLLPFVLSWMQEILLNCLSEIAHANELHMVNAVAVFDSHVIALDDTIWY